jgi:autophagy-related protein 2
VTVHLHEGYDWSSTRKAIEEQAKVVRRRLERIRQLLASGQAPDASADDASILMFGSIQLGLPPGASELPSGQLLAAINEELDDDEGDAISWQHLPGQPATRRTSSTSGKTRKLLTRSKSFAIEVNLQSIKADFDSYSPTSQVASKTSVDVHSFDIIDNVHTSTWRKFLTELRPSDGGTVRASGASMLRFELNKVRPVGKIASSQDEIVMRVRRVPRLEDPFTDAHV